VDAFAVGESASEPQGASDVPVVGSAAYRYLAAADPVLGLIIRSHGHPDPFHWGWTSDRPGSDPFRTLLLQIASQHVSTSASFTIFDRLEAAATAITPERILALGRERLLATGLTDRKADAALGLAEAVTAGRIRLDALPADDASALRQLTALRGIGPWSAQMFLIGQLRRPDILPTADFGIRRGVQRAWQLPALPSPGEVAARGLVWSPYRSYAAALIWTVHFAEPGNGTDRPEQNPASENWRGKRAASSHSAARPRLPAEAPGEAPGRGGATMDTDTPAPDAGPSGAPGPARNRVTPRGDIVAVSGRGAWMGNRGRLHEGSGRRDIVRDHQTRAWLVCALSFRGRRVPQWQPGRYTPLFFLDEAVALAAGHRPCAECRRADYNAYQSAWAAASDGRRLRARDMDERLHRERRPAGKASRPLTEMDWRDLPDGVFVAVDQGAAVVAGDHLARWDEPGYSYGQHVPRPRSGVARVITPPSNVAVLRSGYPLQIDESAR
jgi:3-methyladenine DNA glycosylase/8-oxoguanine DNA glycosylase